MYLFTIVLNTFGLKSNCRELTFLLKMIGNVILSVLLAIGLDTSPTIGKWTSLHVIFLYFMHAIYLYQIVACSVFIVHLLCNCMNIMLIVTLKND